MRLPRCQSLSVRRAWIEISIQIFEKGQARSLSVRRAWIEIPITLDSGALPGVALRKESVDRNVNILHHILANCLSLSVRRAWIEI